MQHKNRKTWSHPLQKQRECDVWINGKTTLCLLSNLADWRVALRIPRPNRLCPFCLPTLMSGSWLEEKWVALGWTFQQLTCFPWVGLFTSLNLFVYFFCHFVDYLNIISFSIQNLPEKPHLRDTYVLSMRAVSLVKDGEFVVLHCKTVSLFLTHHTISFSMGCGAAELLAWAFFVVLLSAL